MKKDYLEIAKIINTHGVRGAVKLEPWCDHPDLLKRIKRLYLENGSSFAVAGVKSLNGGYLVAELSGIDTVEKAIPLKNKVLLAKREDIPVPKGAHFICDLIGLPVIDAETKRGQNAGRKHGPAACRSCLHSKNRRRSRHFRHSDRRLFPLTEGRHAL